MCQRIEHDTVEDRKTHQIQRRTLNRAAHSWPFLGAYLPLKQALLTLHALHTPRKAARLAQQLNCPWDIIFAKP